MPTAELTTVQLRQLVLRPRREQVNGKGLGAILQEAITLDSVSLLERFQEVCATVYEEESAAAVSSRTREGMQESIRAYQRERSSMPCGVASLHTIKPDMWSSKDAETYHNRDVYALRHAPVKTAEERFSEVVNPKLKDTTLLILAAQNHAVKVMAFLLRQARTIVDIEKEGTARFEGEERISGATPLWTAAALGSLDNVKQLVEAGARVNHGSATNSTPLRAACFDGFIDVVKFLADHGGDVNIRNRFGSGPLHLAAYRGFPDIASFLLGHGANPNTCTSTDRESPLHHSALMGHADVAKVLVQHNADTSLLSIHKITPLITGAAGGEEAVVDAILTHATKAHSDEDRTKAFLLLGAAFIDKHDDISLAGKYWKKAMRLGGEKGMAFACGDLKKCSVYGNVTFPRNLAQLQTVMADTRIRNYLALAIREHILGKGNPDTIHYVRCRAALETDEGRYHSAMNLWRHCLSLEIDTSKKGTNADVHSLLTTCTEVLAEQLERTGDGDVGAVFELAWANLGRHPIGSLECGKTLRILLTLLYLWYDLARNEPRHWLPCRQHAVLLVSQRIVLNKGYYGYTPLHLACDKKTFVNGAKSRKNICFFPCPSVLHLLLECGGHEFIGRQDHRGNTPLHIAAQSDSIVCVRELLYYASPADVYRPNEKGKIPAEIATSETIKVLLSNISGERGGGDGDGDDDDSDDGDSQ